MRNFVVTLAVVSTLGLASVAFGADKCADQKKSLIEAKHDLKKLKADYSGCKDKKGKEKKDCRKAANDHLKDQQKDAKSKIADQQHSLDCCKKPKTTQHCGLFGM